jgi:glutamyl-tRNA reductase
LLCISINHRTAPVELRERCTVEPAARPRALASLHRRFGRGVLLSTCGRTELYLDGGRELEAEAFVWLARRARVSPEKLTGHADVEDGAGAVRHAVRVACGLESALEGEDEVLGQLRRAWLDAGGAGMLTPSLDAAFRLAVRSGRQARRIGDPHTWTSLADGAAAHVTLAVQHRQQPQVLIAGSGPMGLRAAESLRRGLGDRLQLTLAGRTLPRVEAHATRLGAAPTGLDGIPSVLACADAAIVGLRTTRTLIGAGDVPSRSEDAPLLIVDLSLPRAVEEAVGRVPGVVLRNVDELLVGEAPRGRWSVAERGRVERLVERAVEEHRTLADRPDGARTLAALRMEAEGIRRTQLERALRRLPELDGDAQQAVEALTHAIVNRLLHEPTRRLRADPHGEPARQVRELFGVGGE